MKRGRGGGSGSSNARQQVSQAADDADGRGEREPKVWLDRFSIGNNCVGFLLHRSSRTLMAMISPVKMRRISPIFLWNLGERQ